MVNMACVSEFRLFEFSIHIFMSYFVTDFASYLKFSLFYHSCHESYFLTTFSRLEYEYQIYSYLICFDSPVYWLRFSWSRPWFPPGSLSLRNFDVLIVSECTITFDVTS